MAYQASHKPDRIKALAGVLAVHVALGAVILTGLNVRTVATTIERLRTFDITEVPPPPPPPPPPSPTPERAKEKEGAAAKKALPTPVVAPPPKIVIPAKSPVVASRVPSTGSAATAGAAASGTGTGAGGSGTGLGGGGRGDYSRFTPARLIRNLTRGDYRHLAGGRLPRGAAIMSIGIEPGGKVDSCRVIRSTGDPIVDAGLCPLISQRLRFRPALDDRGRPIPYRLDYVATWTL